MAENTVTSKDTPGQEDSLDAKEGFGAYLDEMSKMKFVDFRKRSVEAFEEIDTGFDIVQDAMLKNIDWYAKDRNKFLDVIKKRFEGIDSDIGRICDGVADRLESLESILFLYNSTKQSLGSEKRKALASALSIKEDTETPEA